MRTNGLDGRNVRLTFVGVPPGIAAPQGQLFVEQDARCDEADKRDEQHHGIDVDPLLLLGRFNLRLLAYRRLVRESRLCVS